MVPYCNYIVAVFDLFGGVGVYEPHPVWKLVAHSVSG